METEKTAVERWVDAPGPSPPPYLQLLQVRPLLASSPPGRPPAGSRWGLPLKQHKTLTSW